MINPKDCFNLLHSSQIMNQEEESKWSCMIPEMQGHVKHIALWDTLLMHISYFGNCIISSRYSMHFKIKCILHTV